MQGRKNSRSPFVSHPKHIIRTGRPDTPEYGGVGEPATQTDRYKALLAQSDQLHVVLNEPISRRHYGPTPHPVWDLGFDVSERRTADATPAFAVQGKVQLPQRDPYSGSYF